MVITRSLSSMAPHSRAPNLSVLVMQVMVISSNSHRERLSHQGGRRLIEPVFKVKVTEGDRVSRIVSILFTYPFLAGNINQ